MDLKFKVASFVILCLTIFGGCRSESIENSTVPLSASSINGMLEVNRTGAALKAKAQGADAKWVQNSDGKWEWKGSPAPPKKQAASARADLSPINGTLSKPVSSNSSASSILPSSLSNNSSLSPQSDQHGAAGQLAVMEVTVNASEIHGTASNISLVNFEENSTQKINGSLMNTLAANSTFISAAAVTPVDQKMNASNNASIDGSAVDLKHSVQILNQSVEERGDVLVSYGKNDNSNVSLELLQSGKSVSSSSVSPVTNTLSTLPPKTSTTSASGLLLSHTNGSAVSTANSSSDNTTHASLQLLQAVESVASSSPSPVTSAIPSTSTLSTLPPKTVIDTASDSSLPHVGGSVSFTDSSNSGISMISIHTEKDNIHSNGTAQLLETASNATAVSGLNASMSAAQNASLSVSNLPATNTSISLSASSESSVHPSSSIALVQTMKDSTISSTSSAPLTSATTTSSVTTAALANVSHQHERSKIAFEQLEPIPERKMEIKNISDLSLSPLSSTSSSVENPAFSSSMASAKVTTVTGLTNSALTDVTVTNLSSVIPVTITSTMQSSKIATVLVDLNSSHPTTAAPLMISPSSDSVKHHDLEVIAQTDTTARPSLENSTASKVTIAVESVNSSSHAGKVSQSEKSKLVFESLEPIPERSLASASNVSEILLTTSFPVIPSSLSSVATSASTSPAAAPFTVSSSSRKDVPSSDLGAHRDSNAIAHTVPTVPSENSTASKVTIAVDSVNNSTHTGKVSQSEKSKLVVESLEPTPERSLATASNVSGVPSTTSLPIIPSSLSSVTMSMPMSTTSVVVPALPVLTGDGQLHHQNHSDNHLNQDSANSNKTEINLTSSPSTSDASSIQHSLALNNSVNASGLAVLAVVPQHGSENTTLLSKTNEVTPSTSNTKLFNLTSHSDLQSSNSSEGLSGKNTTVAKNFAHLMTGNPFLFGKNPFLLGDPKHFLEQLGTSLGIFSKPLGSGEKLVSAVSENATGVIASQPVTSPTTATSTSTPKPSTPTLSSTSPTTTSTTTIKIMAADQNKQQNSAKVQSLAEVLNFRPPPPPNVNGLATIVSQSKGPKTFNDLSNKKRPLQLPVKSGHQADDYDKLNYGAQALLGQVVGMLSGPGNSVFSTAKDVVKSGVGLFSFLPSFPVGYSESLNNFVAAGRQVTKKRLGGIAG